MKALCWHGTRDVRVEHGPRSADPEPARRDRARDLDGDLRLGSAPLRRLHPDAASRRRARPRVHGRGRGGRPRRSRSLARRRPRGRAVRDRLRRAASTAAQELWSLCDNSNPNAGDGRGALRLLAGRASSATRTSTAAIAGGQAEYVRVPFADVGPLKVPLERPRRAGAVPLRHPPDRLHGGRELRHPPGRRGRGVGLRPGRAVRDPRARCLLGAAAGDRDRSRRRSACAWPRRAAQGRDARLRARRRRRRGAEAAHRRARPGRLHRRGRAWRRTARTLDALLRPGEARDRASAPTGRTRCARRSRRAARAAPSRIPGVYGGYLDKFPMGAAFAKGLTLQHGPDARAPLPAAAARADRRGDIDATVRHHPPPAAASRAGGLSNLPRQGGRAASRSCSTPAA